jgi:hypothetical protein
MAMPLPMRRPDPLKGSTTEGNARLLDDQDVDVLVAQAEEDDEEERKRREEEEAGEADQAAEEASE